MKILHYCPHALVGETGSANAARGWCEALWEKGNQIECLVDQDRVAMEAPLGPDFTPIPHRFSGKARTPVRIAKLMDGADLLVVHGGWVPGNVIAGRAARKVGVPYIVTTHGAYFPEVFKRKSRLKWVWGRAFERNHLNRALAIHLLFPQESEGARLLGTVAPTVVAPNGIRPPEGLSWDGGSGGYLLWLGRFDPHNKGLDLLLHALSALPETARPAVRLHGPDWRNNKRVVASMVQDLRLAQWVSVEEPVYGDDKWQLIAAARGFVYPSRWEASPMAVAEAVSLGVPTLVTPYPMGRFLASRGAALIADSTVGGLAEGLTRLLDPGSVSVGQRGADVAREHLSWPAVAGAWLRQVGKLMADDRLTVRPPVR